MSRIGKHPIDVPDGVTVEVSGQTVTAKGKVGELTTTLTGDIEIAREGAQIWVRPSNESLNARKMWGTARSVISNLVTGVAEGFTRKLELSGVGYRAQMQGNDLVLSLGFSHEVRFPVPDGIAVACPDLTHIVVSGADKQKVGQVAAEIRKYRPPEPYKGKGIRYQDEQVLRKEGKKK